MSGQKVSQRLAPRDHGRNAAYLYKYSIALAATTALMLFAVAGLMVYASLGGSILGVLSQTQFAVLVGGGLFITSVTAFMNSVVLSRVIELLGEQEEEMEIDVQAQRAELKTATEYQSSNLHEYVDHQIDRAEEEILMLTRDPSPEAHAPTLPPDEIFGVSEPVKDVEGIGEKYTKRLQAVGIYDTRQLWETPATDIANSIGVPVRLVQNWQAMAELMSVRGIGGQYAELLAFSGVRSIENLSQQDPYDLLYRVQFTQSQRQQLMQRNKVTIGLCEAWIEEAKYHLAQQGMNEDHRLNAVL